MISNCYMLKLFAKNVKMVFIEALNFNTSVEIHADRSKDKYGYGLLLELWMRVAMLNLI